MVYVKLFIMPLFITNYATAWIGGQAIHTCVDRIFFWCMRRRLFLVNNMLYISIQIITYEIWYWFYCFLSHVINQYINEERNQPPKVKEDSVWLVLWEMNEVRLHTKDICNFLTVTWLNKEKSSIHVKYKYYQEQMNY